MHSERMQAGFSSVVAGALIGAGLEFVPPMTGPAFDFGELVGHTATPLWVEQRLLLWTYDHGQPLADVEAEVTRLRALPAVWRLDQVYRLKPSRELIERLAEVMVQTAWGLDHLRQLATSDARAAATLTGLLEPTDDRELLRDLKIERKADRRNPENSPDLRRVGVGAAVDREYTLRKELGTELEQWITERSLKLSYPTVEGQSTRLSNRWDERRLLAELVDQVARLALPHSPKAGHLRHAAHWAIADDEKQRATAKRGGKATHTPVEKATEALFLTLDGTAPEYRTIEDQVVRRAMFQNALESGERRFGPPFRRFLDTLRATGNFDQAAEAAEIAPRTRQKYVKVLLSLLDIE